MGRRRWLGGWRLTAVTVAAVAAVAIALWFAVGPAGSPGQSATPTGPSFTQAQADDLVGALVSQEPAVVSEVLSADAAAVYEQDPAAVVPPGSSLVVDAGTFEQTSADDALVVGTLDGQQVLLLLAREDDRWLLLTTVGA